MIRPMSALFLALASWAVSSLTAEAYEYTTWQCVVSLVLIDIVFMFTVAISKRIDCIRTDWMCLAFLVSVFYHASFALVTYLMECAFIPSGEGLYLAYSSSFGSVGFAISAIILIIAILPDKLLTGLDNAFRFNRTCHSYVFSDIDSHKNTKEGAE